MVVILTALLQIPGFRELVLRLAGWSSEALQPGAIPWWKDRSPPTKTPHLPCTPPHQLSCLRSEARGLARFAIKSGLKSFLKNDTLIAAR